LGTVAGFREAVTELKYEKVLVSVGILVGRGGRIRTGDHTHPKRKSANFVGITR
jgi:hypothetical protein